MLIELIYPEIANLLGEHGSMQLLELTFGAQDLLYTPYPERPRFLDGGVDFVYMGGMTEKTQALILAKWRPYASAFARRIAGGQAGFFAGNALDLLGRSIVYVDGETIPALGLYPFDTLCRRYDRTNEILSGRFRDFYLMGFRSQFTTQTGDTGAFPFIEVEYGSGMNADTNNEGLNDKNFFATSLNGPFLVLNPEFTKWLFSLFGYHGGLPFEEELLTAARIRRGDLARACNS